MTANTETRKRAREDDITDCVPLSKRINNLHLNNSYNSNNVICNNTSNILQQLQQIDDHYIDNSSIQHTHNNSNPLNGSIISQTARDSTMTNGSQIQCHNIPQNQSNLINSIMETYPQEYLTCDYPLGEYLPELSPDENPYYYNKNKLLYNLFMERMRRQPDNA